MSFIVTGRDIPANCFGCPLDKGVWKQEQDPFILCRYTKEKVNYDDVPTDRRLPCCWLKEIPEKHGRTIDENWLKKAIITTLEALKKNPKMDGQEMHLIAAFDTLRAMIDAAPTIVEAEGE